jgi:hypothetical protein
MTPRLSAALARIDWTPRAWARQTGIATRTATRWAAGVGEPPETLLAWTEALADWIEAHPAPRKIICADAN